VRSLFICEALLKERTDAKVRCLTCQRRCELAEGQVGWCRTRQNWDGTLYALNYGLISSISANPIEKKPLFHFYPGSLALTAGSFSCNFGCPWCQNWHTSKQHPPVIQKASRRTSSDDDHFGASASQDNRRGERGPGLGWYMSPEGFVSEARSLGCQGTSVSFNEPTLSLEWSLDVFRLARNEGLYNTYVTNGYMTPEALLMLVEAGLDGMNVDL
jgi:pyruvate formate lyase activating enzyme